MKSRSLSMPVVALFAAVAMVIGSFSAATAAGVTVNQVKKLANKQITARAPGLTVAKAGSATNAKNADVAAVANSVAPDSVGTNGIVNSTITGSDIASGTIPAGDIAAGVVPTVLWARVTSTGTLSSGRGAVSSVRNAAGNYTVNFNTTVTNCAAVVTPGNNDQAAFYDAPSGTSVTVDLELIDGTQFDTPFSVAVFC